MMNAMSDEPERDDGPAIILIGIDKKTFYLFKGEEFIDQIMLVDGVFPQPILCVHFETIFDAKRVIGEALNVQSCWGIHPDIVARLRDTDCLIETDA